MIPERVDDHTLYWTDLPPEPSARCTWWVSRIHGGWRPNRRIRREGYEGATVFYGVYIAEYVKVLSPLLEARSEGEDLVKPIMGEYGYQNPQ